MNFLELAENVLRETQKPLTWREIWQKAEELGFDQELKTKGKTPWDTLSARLYVEVRDNPDGRIQSINTRPRQFYLKDFEDQVTEENFEAPEAEQVEPTEKFDEKDLHPILTNYAFYHLKCYTKTINHAKSSKKEYMEWVHPDLVGVHFPLEEWEKEVAEFNNVMGSNPTKLYSFELKKYLDFSNLRESFFQTVSNSSWAHEGYLVAKEILDDQEFRDELKRLSTSFGIGIINLDIEDSDNSKVLYPAQAKDCLDWGTINKMVINPDFNIFIEGVKNDIISKEPRKERYDPIN